ncbi:phiSA1p31-related protein [Streptomyces eurythermus]
MAFKAGDKVETFSGKTGEVVYGPAWSTFGSYTGYVVKVDGEDVWYKANELSAVPELPTFAVGDKVNHRTFGAGEIAFGPFEHHNGPAHYLIKDEVGKHALVQADAMEAATTPEFIKVGDRVRVTDEDTYEYDGVTYDLSAKYRDKDGDRLKIKLVNGVARVGWFGEEPNSSSYGLAYAIRQYGPLTRVHD